VTVTVRSLSCVVTFNSVSLTDVISARGQVSADGGWPTCSVFVSAKPASGNEEDALSVVAGAGNNVTRFTGRLRRFRSSAFPKAVELYGTGTLAYAAEWAPSEDIVFATEFPTGATDQELIEDALTRVVRIGSGGYSSGNIGGTGTTLGTLAPSAFDWSKGTTAWARIQAIDRATLYRTYQQADGTIRRVQMIGHPSSSTTSFTLENENILESSTGSRNTEQTRNYVVVQGHDYGFGTGPVLGTAEGAFGSLDGSDPDERITETYASDFIEDGNDPTGTPLALGAGLDAQAIADDILPDVLKEFVDADVLSWSDGTHGPGQTCMLDTTIDIGPLSGQLRLLIAEKMWVRGYGWEIGDKWESHYVLSGGGLESYTPPPI
jgi:hypothetical protein